MRHDLRRGALYAVAAAAAFTVTGACIKHAAATTPNEVVVFFRNAVALLALLPWLYNVRLAGLRTQRLLGHLLRAGFGTAAMYCFFYAIGRLPLAEAILLNYSAPLFIPLIAWAWIREPLPLIVLPAAALGLVGVALVARPEGGGLISPAGALGALSGLLAASAMVSIRRVSDTEPVPRIVFYFALLSTLISAVPLAWAWQMPTRPALLALIGTGLSATVGQLCLTQAYALAPAARVGTFSYTAVIFSAALGWLLWDEVIDGRAALGALLIVATCVLASWPGRPVSKAVAPVL